MLETRTLGAATLGDFLRQLAAKTPCPGGGSASAYAGAVGASLVAMVAQLTEAPAAPDSDDAPAQTTMEILAEQGEALTEVLARDVDRDAAAFQAVADAYKLPKDTDEAKQARSRAIQAALQGATEVPLEVATDGLAVADLALAALEHGNPNAASDAGVAALLAIAGAQGAMLNVAINLASLKDATWAAEREQALLRLRDRSFALHAELWEALDTKFPVLGKPGPEDGEEAPGLEAAREV